MRIAIMGQAAFGAKVLDVLAERGEEVVAAWLPQSQGKPPAKPDPLQVAADARRIPCFRPESYKSEQALRDFQGLHPELLIMAFVTDIIPPAFIAVPTQGAICYHPSLLPRHRGGSAINWALMMGDTETGLTVFWTDAGIDTGPILLQRRIPIGPEDTTGSLYFDQLFPLGVEAIAESVTLIRAGRAPRLIQDERFATYEPLCNDKVAGIDWSRSRTEVHNHIRGCDPQPGAYSFHAGQKVRFFEARIETGRPGGKAGEVLSIDGPAIVVAAGDGAVRIGKVRSDAGKEEAGAFAARIGLKPGDCFTGG